MANIKGIRIEWLKDDCQEWQFVTLLHYSLAKYSKGILGQKLGFSSNKEFLYTFAKLLNKYGWKTKGKNPQQIYNTINYAKKYFKPLVEHWSDDEISQIKFEKPDYRAYENFNKYEKMSLEDICQKFKSFLGHPYDLTNKY